MGKLFYVEDDDCTPREISPIGALRFLPNVHKAFISSSMSAFSLRFGLDNNNEHLRDDIYDGLYPSSTITLSSTELDLLLGLVTPENGELSGTLYKKLKDAR